MTPALKDRTLLVSGLAGVAAVATVALVFFSSIPRDSAIGLMLALLLVAISLPSLRKHAQGDHILFWMFVWAILLKMFGAFVRHFVAFDVYEGVADAAGYHTAGVQLAERFREANFATGLESLTGTDFVRFFTGLLYTVIGPTKLGGYFFYSWMGFWGLVYFYRAFAITFPEGATKTYAKLVFFLPSMLFWPSGLGKDALMCFGLGLAAFGAARAFSGAIWRGVLRASVGLWFAAMIRPHVAGLMAISLAAGYLLNKPPEHLRQLAPMIKIASLAVLIVVTGFLVMRTSNYLEESGIDTQTGVTGVLDQSTLRTGQGGSQFTPSATSSPARVPMGIVTVLFRPALIEAQNVQAGFAALETTFLLGLTILWIRRLLRTVGRLRRYPYVAFAIFYVVVFCVGFSGVGNFGILARQRVQVLPFFLILLCAFPKPKPLQAKEVVRRTELAHAA